MATYGIELNRYEQDLFFTYGNLLLKKDKKIIFSGKSLELSPLNPSLKNITKEVGLFKKGNYNLTACVELIDSNKNIKYITACNGKPLSEYTKDELINRKFNDVDFMFKCDWSADSGLLYGCIPLNVDYFNLLTAQGGFNFTLINKNELRNGFLEFFRDSGLAKFLQDDGIATLTIKEDIK